jgi:hypothetical protein
MVSQEPSEIIFNVKFRDIVATGFSEMLVTTRIDRVNVPNLLNR